MIIEHNKPIKYGANNAPSSQKSTKKRPEGPRFTVPNLFYYITMLFILFVCIFAILLEYNLSGNQKAFSEVKTLYSQQLHDGKQLLGQIESLRHSLDGIRSATDDFEKRHFLTNANSSIKRHFSSTSMEYHAIKLLTLVAILDTTKQHHANTLEHLRIAESQLVKTLLLSWQAHNMNLHNVAQKPLHYQLEEWVNAPFGEKMYVVPEELPHVFHGQTSNTMHHEIAISLTLWQRALQEHWAVQNKAALLHQQANVLLKNMAKTVSDSAIEKANVSIAPFEHNTAQLRLIMYTFVGVISLTVFFLLFFLHLHIALPLTKLSQYLVHIQKDPTLPTIPKTHLYEVNALFTKLSSLGQSIRNLSTHSKSLEKEKDKFKNLSLLDALTGVSNRRAFDTFLADIDPRYSLAIILIDVDMFKKYNDTYGHQAGDNVLSKVAKAMRRALWRSTDQLFRYGGEEFCILLPGTTKKAALDVAERLRKQVHKLHIPHASSSVDQYVTISVGVALRLDNSPTSSNELLIQADNALYKAKEWGRNNVYLLAENPSFTVKP